MANVFDDAPSVDEQLKSLLNAPIPGEEEDDDIFSTAPTVQEQLDSIVVTPPPPPDSLPLEEELQIEVPPETTSTEDHDPSKPTLPQKENPFDSAPSLEEQEKTVVGAGNINQLLLRMSRKNEQYPFLYADDLKAATLEQPDMNVSDVLSLSAAETNYGKNTKSFTGVRGAMQVTDSTGKDEFEKNKIGREFNVESSRDQFVAGNLHFNRHLDNFNGDYDKAVAAYNAGAGTVRQAELIAEREGIDWKEALPKTQSIKNFNLVNQKKAKEKGIKVATKEEEVFGLIDRFHKAKSELGDFQKEEGITKGEMAFFDKVISEKIGQPFKLEETLTKGDLFERLEKDREFFGTRQNEASKFSQEREDFIKKQLIKQQEYLLDNPDVAEIVKQNEEWENTIATGWLGVLKGADGVGMLTGNFTRALGQIIDSDIVKNIGDGTYTYFSQRPAAMSTPKKFLTEKFKNKNWLQKTADLSWLSFTIGEQLPLLGLMYGTGGAAGATTASLGTSAASLVGKELSKQAIANLTKAGLFMGGGLTGGSAEGLTLYRELLDMGQSEDEALLSGGLMTGLSTGLNALGLSKILRKLPKNIGGKALSVSSSGAWEAITELMEEPSSVLSTELGLSGQQYDDISDSMLKATVDGLDVLGPSFIIGALVAISNPNRSMDESAELVAEKVKEIQDLATKTNKPFKEVMEDAAVQKWFLSPTEVSLAEVQKQENPEEFVEKSDNAYYEQILEDNKDLIGKDPEDLNQTDKSRYALLSFAQKSLENVERLELETSEEELAAFDARVEQQQADIDRRNAPIPLQENKTLEVPEKTTTRSDEIVEPVKEAPVEPVSEPIVEPTTEAIEETKIEPETTPIVEEEASEQQERPAKETLLNLKNKMVKTQQEIESIDQIISDAKEAKNDKVVKQHEKAKILTEAKLDGMVKEYETFTGKEPELVKKDGDWSLKEDHPLKPDMTQETVAELTPEVVEEAVAEPTPVVEKPKTKKKKKVKKTEPIKVEEKVEAPVEKTGPVETKLANLEPTPVKSKDREFGQKRSKGGKEAYKKYLKNNTEEELNEEARIAGVSPGLSKTAKAFELEKRVISGKVTPEQRFLKTTVGEEVAKEKKEEVDPAFIKSLPVEERPVKKVSKKRFNDGVKVTVERTSEDQKQIDQEVATLKTKIKGLQKGKQTNQVKRDLKRLNDQLKQRTAERTFVLDKVTGEILQIEGTTRVDEETHQILPRTPTKPKKSSQEELAQGRLTKRAEESLKKSRERLKSPESTEEIDLKIAQARSDIAVTRRAKPTKQTKDNLRELNKKLTELQLEKEEAILEQVAPEIEEKTAEATERFDIKSKKVVDADEEGITLSEDITFEEAKKTTPEEVKILAEFNAEQSKIRNRVDAIEQAIHNLPSKIRGSNVHFELQETIEKLKGELLQTKESIEKGSDFDFESVRVDVLNAEATGESGLTLSEEFSQTTETIDEANIKLAELEKERKSKKTPRNRKTLISGQIKAINSVVKENLKRLDFLLNGERTDDIDLFKKHSFKMSPETEAKLASQRGAVRIPSVKDMENGFKRIQQIVENTPRSVWHFLNDNVLVSGPKKANKLMGVQFRRLIHKKKALEFLAQTEIVRITKKLSPLDLELMTFLMEKTGIPKKLGRKDLEDRYAEYLKDPKIFSELDADLKKVKGYFKTMFNFMKDGDKKFNAKQIEDYITHVWGVKKKKIGEASEWMAEKFKTENPFSNKRFFKTYEEGINKGYIPKNLSIVHLMDIHAKYAIRTIANQQFIDLLKHISSKDKPFIALESKIMDETGKINPKYANFQKTTNNNFAELKEQITKTGKKITQVDPYYYHKDVEPAIKVMFDTFQPGPYFRFFRALNSFYKTTNLSYSFFHHNALIETSVATLGLAKTIDIITDMRTMFKVMSNKEYVQLRKVELTALAIERGLQINDIIDVDRALVEKGLQKVEDYMKENNIQVAKQLVTAFNFVNKKNNEILWNFLHNSFKLSAFEHIVKMQKDDARTPAEQELNEMNVAQFVNDTFGGQIFESFMFSPKTIAWSKQFFLSPDWNFSAIRQALSLFAVGDITKTKEGALLRHKMGRNYWIRAGIYMIVSMNMMNAVMRLWDEEDKEDQKKKLIEKDLTKLRAEELNNRHLKTGNLLDRSNYKEITTKIKESEATLKSLNTGVGALKRFGENPDKYLMTGNAKGHGTHLFTGRYSDGKARYLRLFKQYRELPEMFWDFQNNEVSPLAAPVKKALGKMSPMWQLPAMLAFSTTSGGFKLRDLSRIKEEGDFIDYGFSVIKEVGKLSAPFVLQGITNDYKEFAWTDVFAQSSKGMTESKAKAYVLKSIKNNGKYEDDILRAMRENGINPFKVYDAVAVELDRRIKEDAKRNAKHKAGWEPETVGEAIEMHKHNALQVRAWILSENLPAARKYLKAKMDELEVTRKMYEDTPISLQEGDTLELPN